MPNRCVVYGCSNTSNTREGTALHAIPFPNDDRPEAKKRRKVWVNFVKQKRKKWEPSSHSVICSKHFKAEDFEQRYTVLPGQEIKPVIPSFKEGWNWYLRLSGDTLRVRERGKHYVCKRFASHGKGRHLYFFKLTYSIFLFSFCLFFYPLRCTALNIVRLKRYRHKIFLKRLPQRKFQ